MIDSVVLISQGPILFFATAESNRQCCRSFTTRLQMSSKKWAKKYRKPFILLGFRQSRRRDSFSAPLRSSLNARPLDAQRPLPLRRRFPKTGDTLRYLRLFVRRGDGIRTHDLCVPNAALYQTEPRLDLYIRKTRMTAFAVSKCHNTKPRMRCQQENFTLGRPSLTQWPSWENFRSVTVMTTATAPEEISIAMPTMVKVLTKPSASTIMPPKRLLMIEAAPP